MAHKQNIAPQICRFPADLSRVQWAIDHFFRPLLPVVSIKKLSSDPWNGAHGGSRQLELGQRRAVDFTVRYIAENVFLPYGHRGSNKYSWYVTTQQNCNEGVLFKRFTLWTLRHFLHSFQVGLLKDDLTGGVQVRYSYYRYEIFSSGNTCLLVWSLQKCWQGWNGLFRGVGRRWGSCALTALFDRSPRALEESVSFGSEEFV